MVDLDPKQDVVRFEVETANTDDTAYLYTAIREAGGKVSAYLGWDDDGQGIFVDVRLIQ